MFLCNNCNSINYSDNCPTQGKNNNQQLHAQTSNEGNQVENERPPIESDHDDEEQHLHLMMT